MAEISNMPLATRCKECIALPLVPCCIKELLLYVNVNTPYSLVDIGVLLLLGGDVNSERGKST